MSGCHNTETTEVKTCPHGVRLEDVCKRCYENSRNTHPCIGCGVPVCDCKCIWNSFREMYQMFSKLDTRVEELEDRIKHTEEDLNYVPTTEALCALVERVKELEESYQGQFHEISNLEDEVAALQSHADKVDTCFGEVLESGKTFHVSKETIGKTVEKSLDARLSLTQRIDELKERLDKHELITKNDIHGLTQCHNNLMYRVLDMKDENEDVYKTEKSPHKCPVCEGKGGFLSTDPNKCHACAGTGIVWG